MLGQHPMHFLAYKSFGDSEMIRSSQEGCHAAWGSEDAFQRLQSPTSVRPVQQRVLIKS